jgi:hypothetical protein
MQIRAFQPADAERISDLLTQHSPYKRDAAFWIWLNRTLPTRSSLVAVAESDGQVVGHYGILPFDLRLPDGTLAKAGHGVHAFVKPDFREQVSIFEITKLAYKLARDAGLVAVFGFPNVNYRLIQEKIERWRCVSLFKAWTKQSNGSSDSASGVRLESADFTDKSQLQLATNLWEIMDVSSLHIAITGQARWWMIRYVLHPQRPYSFYWYVRQGMRRGLIVAKLFIGTEETRAHIIDYVLTDGETPDDMLRAFEFELSTRATRFVHWPVEPTFVKALQNLGYQPDGFETYFGLRRLETSPTLSNPVSDPMLETSAWRLPMGLSDAF